MTVAATGATALCPLCQRGSVRVHSRYQRTVADLPVSGREVAVVAHVRRFQCLTSSCPRRIFAERLPSLVAPHARKSHSLRQALERVGFANGGEAGARLAGQLGMRTSADTLLRLIRAAPTPDAGHPRIVGIDDWAYKRGLRYGPIICDLERHRPADLLPDRSADSVAAWLRAHPSGEVAARDRGGLYADGIARGAPQAVQVADRWHVVDNLADALEKFLLHKGMQLKEAASALVAAAAAPGEGGVPTEEVYQGKRRLPQPRLGEQRMEEDSARRVAVRRAMYDQVHALYAKGAKPMDSARMTGVSRNTVYRYLQAGSRALQSSCASRMRLRLLAGGWPHRYQRGQQE